MASVTYKIKDCSKQFLQNHKFRYNSYLSECRDEIYTYKFPLVSYNTISNSKMTTVECEISISTITGRVNVNVYNAGTRELYAQYYNREFGDCELLKSIDTKINKKLNELGIEKE